VSLRSSVVSRRFAEVGYSINRRPTTDDRRPTTDDRRPTNALNA
jgi:hypothetical protein